jgi:hypothetical protein
MEEQEIKHQRRVIAAQKPKKQRLSNGSALHEQWPSNQNQNQIKEGKPLVLKKGKEKMSGKVPLEENSEAFKAWVSYLKHNPPRTNIRIDGKLVRGWYFPAEYPPVKNAEAKS